MGPGPNAVGLTRGHILDAVKESLDRLGTDHIDLHQIHGADSVTPIEETLRALDDLVRSGQVRYIGCSNLMGWQIMKGLGTSAREGLERFETVQAYYSIASRDLEREIIPLMVEERLGLMVWSPARRWPVERQIQPRYSWAERCAAHQFRFSAGRTPACI